jgi:hypothetical protein
MAQLGRDRTQPLCSRCVRHNGVKLSLCQKRQVGCGGAQSLLSNGFTMLVHDLFVSDGWLAVMPAQSLHIRSAYCSIRPHFRPRRDGCRRCSVPHIQCGGLQVFIQGKFAVMAHAQFICDGLTVMPCGPFIEHGLTVLANSTPVQDGFTAIV